MIYSMSRVHESLVIHSVTGRDDLAKQKDVTKGKDVRLEPKATIRPLPRNSKVSNYCY